MATEFTWMCRAVSDTDREDHEYWDVICERYLGTREETEVDEDAQYVVIEMPDGKWFISPSKWDLDHDADIGPYVSYAKVVRAVEMLIAQEGETE